MTAGSWAYYEEESILKIGNIKGRTQEKFKILSLDLDKMHVEKIEIPSIFK